MINPLGPYKSPFQFDVALLEPATYMARRGLRVDLKLRRELSEKREEEISRMQKDLIGIVGLPLNANSPKQVKEWLYEEMGVKPRTRGKKATADETALRAIMAEAENKLSTLKQTDAREKWMRVLIGVKIILKIKKARTEKSRYLDIPIDNDGRLRCNYIVGGAETGRFSHQQTPWDTGCNAATIPKSLRCIIIPDDGYELAEFDLNRGESWVYSFLSLDPELMRIHLEGGDFHSETASAISIAFGSRHYTVDEVISLYKSGDKFGYRLRYLGKRINHASSYRMGPFRGAEIVNEESDETGITVTVAQMRKSQELWRQKYFMVPEWWRQIELKLEKDRTLITPYGRKRVFYGFWGEELFKEATAFVPQSTSVDYLNVGMLKVYNELVKKGLCELLHQQHDSILIQYREERRAEVIPEVMSRLVSKLVINGHEISIPVEAKYGPVWEGDEVKEWRGS